MNETVELAIVRRIKHKRAAKRISVLEVCLSF